MIEKNEPKKTIQKLNQMLPLYEELIFPEIAELSAEYYLTQNNLFAPPKEAKYKPVKNGTVWGKKGQFAWFRTDFTVPKEWANTPLYLRAITGGRETMLIVDGKEKGLFNCPLDFHPYEALGDHHTLLLAAKPKARQTIHIDLEAYPGHFNPGTMPFEQFAPAYQRTFHRVTVHTSREDVKDFVFDLKTLLSLYRALPEDSFWRGTVQNALFEVYRTVKIMPQEFSEAEWRPALQTAREIMRPILESKNSSHAPFAGLIGHSHMDTAWLWTIDTTVKKCARTYSNALSLMEQYPEYRFVQSSAYHAKVLKEHYPSIYKQIVKRTKEGRWEPNGAVWIECDCNMPSGESMVRQFLWGQKFTQKEYGYTADTFWLPDTFGYSAAIPQIMKGARVKYFLTTKLGWNDTNRFPYDTFYWNGMDGSRVLVHFNETNSDTSPEALAHYLKESVRNKSVNDRRLISFGKGDGGGGPHYELLEMARRVKDLEGIPKAEFTTVSAFMNDLEQSSVDIPEYHGELYVEIHRGTLTNMMPIKYQNRKGEVALRNLEILSVMQKAKNQSTIDRLYEVLLVHQFHDILPGTCIHEAHAEAISAVGKMIDEAKRETAQVIQTGHTLYNTLNWTRSDYYLDTKWKGIEGASTQVIQDLSGKSKLYVHELPLLSMSATSVKEGKASKEKSAFSYQKGKNLLLAPWGSVTFDEYGYLASYVVNGRELVHQLPLNTLQYGEDIPSVWDNWDIDSDLQMKLQPVTRLVNREVVSDGALQFRIRSEYQLSERSFVRQDMVFYAHTPRIDFETEIHWYERHRFLSAAFDLELLADSAKHEVQFGYVERPTYKNNSFQKAMYEVSNQKYTDISEPNFGVAILNDARYGISVDGKKAALSLAKCGTHPDPEGCDGVHKVTYSILPHGAFSAEAVVRPAYELNVPVLIGGGEEQESYLSIDAPQIVVEAIKPAWEGKDTVVRLYEAERTRTEAVITLPKGTKKAWLCNLLEENEEALPIQNGTVTLSFRPFEIKSLKLRG